LDRNGLSVSTETACRFEPKSPVGNSEICITDPRGKWQHLAHHVRTINEDFLNEGVMFDGSSIAGWKAIMQPHPTPNVAPEPVVRT
jgi:glutamine synthetase